MVSGKWVFLCFEEEYQLIIFFKIVAKSYDLFFLFEVS